MVKNKLVHNKVQWTRLKNLLGWEDVGGGGFRVVNIYTQFKTRVLFPFNKTN